MQSRISKRKTSKPQSSCGMSRRLKKTKHKKVRKKWREKYQTKNTSKKATVLTYFRSLLVLAGSLFRLSASSIAAAQHRMKCKTCEFQRFIRAHSSQVGRFDAMCTTLNNIARSRVGPGGWRNAAFGGWMQRVDSFGSFDSRSSITDHSIMDRFTMTQWQLKSTKRPSPPNAQPADQPDHTNENEVI